MNVEKKTVIILSVDHSSKRMRISGTQKKVYINIYM